MLHKILISSLFKIKYVIFLISNFISAYKIFSNCSNKIIYLFKMNRIFKIFIRRKMQKYYIFNYGKMNRYPILASTSLVNFIAFCIGITTLFQISRRIIFSTQCYNSHTMHAIFIILFKFIKYFYKEKYNEVEFHTRNIDFKIYVD